MFEKININGEKILNFGPVWGCLAGFGNDNNQYTVDVITRDGYLTLNSSRSESEAAVLGVANILQGTEGLKNPNVWIEIKDGIILLPTAPSNISNFFEPSVIDKLDSYVYALIDPRTDQPFYIGKGRGNRVFSHVACQLEEQKSSDKYDTINDINKNCIEGVKHLIIRHGMSDEAAFEVESALIDLCHTIKLSINNIVLGKGSAAFGSMTSDEVIRKYKAEPLSEIGPGCVIININKTYQRAKGQKSYYEATKELWPISEKRIKSGLNFALAEYKGFIVEVFKINDWYGVDVKNKNGSTRKRWGFNGEVADDETRSLYLNRSIKKLPGAAFPIRYNL